MKILVDNEIQSAVLSCRPTKIAVAYIGADWNTFIPDASCLEAIIVSPTFGSNPWAITDLVRQIGWEKIFFLDELHAKTYVGKKSAVIGSANLTRNGLAAEGLVELCVEVYSEESLRKVNVTFDDLKKRAQEQYPTKEEKKERLKELERSWGAAIANRIMKGEKRKVRPFVEFEPLGSDHFYVIWYQPVDCEYSEDVKAIQSLIADDLHFAITDKPVKNKWALVWRITDTYKPHRSAKPHWLYIHEVFENGVIDDNYEYPNCAIQRKDLEVPPFPFELTNDVIAALKAAVQEESVAEYLIQARKGVFSLAYSQKGVPLLIDRMKGYLANNETLVDAKKRRG